MAQTSTLRWNGRIRFARTEEAGRRGMRLALEYLLGESNRIIPLDEGTLERSGRVMMAPDGMQGAISYDTVYAVRQHEELSYKHLPGRQAKYLETTMNTKNSEAMAIIAATIRQYGFLGGRLG